LAILEDQVVSLEGELEQLEFRSKQEILGLETQLNEASKELEAARMEIRNVKTAFEVHRGEMEVGCVMSPVMKVRTM